MSQQPQFRPVKEMSYSEAMEELQNIVDDMQGDYCSIDNLAAYTLRAAELIRECRSRLTATDEQLRNVLAELKQQ